MVGTIVGIAFAALLFWCVLVGVPYLYRGATVRWAGSPGADDSVAGVWVGTLSLHGKTDYDAFVRAGGRGVPPKSAAEPAAMQLTANKQLTWGVQKFKGEVKVCGRSGLLYTGAYTGETLLGGSHLQLLLRASEDTKNYSHLRAEFAPGSMSVQLPMQDGRDATGSLHKQGAEQFQQLCRDLQTR